LILLYTIFSENARGILKFLKKFFCGDKNAEDDKCFIIVRGNNFIFFTKLNRNIFA